MDVLTGQVLQNRYFLRRLVGSGGMADVYEAWDRSRNSTMAIKILRDDPNRKHQLVQMFEEEAYLLNQIEHPNIVRIYDFKQDGQHYFIIMEWVDGKDLRKELIEHQQAFQPLELLPILQPICAALSYAHVMQVFHCDIKPANIMRSKKGEVKLADFGIARLAGKPKGGGTPLYMAPEQFLADGAIGAWTDIYALGVLLFELLSGGSLPFRGTSPNSQGNTSNERVAWEHLYLPPPLENLSSFLPSALLSVLECALQKRFELRFQNTMEFLRAFEQACVSQTGTLSLSHTQMASLPSEVKLYNLAALGQTPVVDWENDKKPGNVQPKEGLDRQTEQRTAQQPGNRVMQAQLVIPNGAQHPIPPFLEGVSGILKGRFVAMCVPVITIGRDSQNLLPLQDATISRHHAVIKNTRNKKHYLQDMNSINGTYHNNRRLQNNELVELKQGARIQFGFHEQFIVHLR